MAETHRHELMRPGLERILKVVTYTLIVVFKLRHRRLSANKMQIFFSACHFLRRVRQLVVHTGVELHETPRTLVRTILRRHGALRPDLDCGNLLICGPELLPSASKDPKWVLVGSKTATRWVAVVALPVLGMKNHCFADRQLIHNLGGSAIRLHPETLRERCGSHTTRAEVVSTIADSEGDLLLEDWFTIPRYVQVGDLVLLGQGRAFAVRHLATSPSSPKSPGLFVVKGVTSLYCTGGAGPGPVPGRTMKLRHGTGRSPLDSFERISDCVISHQPKGLHDKCQLLVDAIRPFLRGDFLENPSLPAPTFLISGVSGSGKRTVVRAASKSLGLRFVETSCLALLGESSKATELRLANALQQARQLAPALFYLTDLEVIGKAREGHGADQRLSRFFTAQVRQNGKTAPGRWPLFVVGACRDDARLSADVYGALLHKIRLDVPSKERRGAMLRWILDENCLDVGVEDFDVLVRLSHGLHFGDLNAIVSLATRHTAKQLAATTGSTIINRPSLDHAIDAVRRWQSESMNAPSIPEVRWQDVGGLEGVIRQLLDTIQLPLQHPQLVASGLKRSGVLLYGPPGTGKTLLAKAVATECGLHFLSVKGPELLNMYVGQSEENVRRVFESARAASPCLIFFDELDALAPARGRSGDSGGVMDRVVSQLLAELDGVDKSAVVFVVAATNRPDLIDPALLRPGRFDKLLYLGVNDSKTNQLAVLRALTRKFSLDADVDLQAVVELLPACLTGADLYAFCSDAVLSHNGRLIHRIQQGGNIDRAGSRLSMEDFVEASQRLVPSVSPQDLASYRQLQQQFEPPRPSMSQ